MQVAEKTEAVSFENLGQEAQFYWGRLPDKMLFLVLLGVWALLFSYYGCTLAVGGQANSSLYDWMWNKWTDPANDAAHGKLIPWVVLGLLWLRRRRLMESVTGVWWPGLVGLALMLLLHVVGFIVQQPRVSQIALFGGGWVLTGLIWGPETLKVTFFPFFMFAFCVPLGGTFAQGLTLKLRMGAAAATEFITHNLLDVKVARTGTALFDPDGVYGRFDVAAECSGIRSLTALLAITLMFSALTLKTTWKRVVMIFSAIPLALVCNVLRVTTIILAANTFKAQEAGQYVDKYFGYVTYLIAIAGVLLLGKLLKDRPQDKTP